MLINRIPVLFIAGALTHFSPATAASGDLEARVMMGQPLSSPCPMYAAYDQDSKSCSCYSGYSPTYGRHGRLMSCSATAYSLPAGSYCLPTNSQLSQGACSQCSSGWCTDNQCVSGSSSSPAPVKHRPMPQVA